jgi:hypothetical protein
MSPFIDDSSPINMFVQLILLKVNFGRKINYHIKEGFMWFKPVKVISEKNKDIFRCGVLHEIQSKHEFT